MAGYIIRDREKTLALPARQVDQLLAAADGEAALLYLYLMRAEDGVTAEELMDKLGLIPGAVTPLSALNDQEGAVQVFIDRELSEEPGLVAVNPNDNTATVLLKTEDLIRVLRENGHTVENTEL